MKRHLKTAKSIKDKEKTINNENKQDSTVM